MGLIFIANIPLKLMAHDSLRTTIVHMYPSHALGKSMESLLFHYRQCPSAHLRKEKDRQTVRERKTHRDRE